MTKKECMDRIEHLEKTVEIQENMLKRLKELTGQLTEALIEWNRWCGAIPPK